MNSYEETMIKILRKDLEKTGSKLKHAGLSREGINILKSMLGFNRILLDLLSSHLDTRHSS